MSTRRKTSLPGAISMYSEAMPAMGRSPCVIVPTNEANCGCMRSRKRYARSWNSERSAMKPHATDRLESLSYSGALVVEPLAQARIGRALGVALLEVVAAAGALARCLI